jgi:hypothetical protein
MDNLYDMVERLMTSVFSAAIRNHNILVNEIPADLAIAQNDEWVASIITGILTIAATNTTGNFIKLSARDHEHMLVLEIQEFNKIPFNNDLRQLQKLAEKIGGSLSLSVQNPDKSVILFSFPNATIPA